jgi:ATP-dependent DNA helicase RecG
MVEDGIAAIRRNLSRRTRVQSLLREDEWDYPVEVIRELVVNALMHRDLSPAARGTQARVEIYPDRFVVTNPGGLFGPVSPADLGVVTVTSSRNARLGKLLEDTPLAGGDPVAENRGSGFVTLTRRLDAIGMSRPTVRARVADFAVILNSASLLDDVALDVLDGLDTDGWTDLDRLVVAVASREGDVTNERMREVSGEHPADVGASFVRLADLGVLERRGSGRGSRWRLVVDGHPQVDTHEEHVELAAAEFAPQAVEVLRALAQGPISSTELAALVAIGSKRNVLLWLNRLEDRGLVEPTALRRRSPANRWRLTDGGFAALDLIEDAEAEGVE